MPLTVVPHEVAYPIVMGDSPGAATGHVRFRGIDYRCALGSTGIKADKREGDGATPAGLWPLREILYRPDRLSLSRLTLPKSMPVRALLPDDGWCDAPGDPRYNQHVRHPYAAGAEHLWLDDEIYDLIVVLGYNDRPAVAGKGSAIFMHVARPGYAPTAGCVALALPDLLALLAVILFPASIAIVGPG